MKAAVTGKVQEKKARSSDSELISTGAAHRANPYFIDSDGPTDFDLVGDSQNGVIDF